MSVFIKITDNAPEPNSYFMAYNGRTGEMFINYWMLTEFNNFYTFGEFTHWGPIWGDVKNPHELIEQWRKELIK